MRVVTTQLPDDMIQTLDHLAEREGRSKSWLIREALEDYLAKQKELETLTMEGLEAIRSDDLVAHSEVMEELDRWGN